MNDNMPKMALVTEKKSVIKVVKITPQRWGNVHKVKLLIQQVLLDPSKPLAPPQDPAPLLAERHRLVQVSPRAPATLQK